MREEYEHWLQILMTVAGFVLLIVCANVANLMLVQAMERRQQTSLSMALGHIAHDSSNRLSQITDVLGLVSQFSYDSSSLINAMTTPYGTTQLARCGRGSPTSANLPDVRY